MSDEKIHKRGFKGFNKGLKCLNKQYAENAVFVENGGNICGAGVIHFCEEPLAVLNYYPIFNTNTKKITSNEFAEVEALADCQQDGDKFATTKIKIGAKINLAGLCKAQIEYIKEKTKNTATTGNEAHSATTGNEAHSATTGDYAHSATTGWKAHSATTGWKAHSATTGDYAHSATTGWKAHSATTGDYAHSATTGDYAHSATTGDYAHSATTGNEAHSATTGDYAHSATTGDYEHSATTGWKAHSATTGKNSISAALGGYSWAKAAKGSWIVLAEYDDNNNILSVKTAKVDGENIKENIFYKLENGEFVEAEK